jgi:hypothetical protein
MKNTKLIAIVSLLLLAASAASAQSLGDYARTARKDKAAASPTSRHFDNDNLPVNDTLSVVGQAPQPASVAGDAGKDTDSKVGVKTADAKSADAKSADPKAAADKQKAAEEMKKKMDQQQEKINSLNREIDLDQREERLRAAAYYQDAGTRLRNPAEWNKGQTQDINDAAEKQKSLDTARQQLEQMKEDARKAGIAQNDKDKDKDASNQNK